MLVRTAEDDAAQVLTETWPALDVPRAVPVDPVQIASSLGIEVYGSALPDGEAGRLVKLVGGEPAIHLQRSEPLPRLRFTCAHEIGHYVRRAASGDDEYAFRDRHDHLFAVAADEEESYANRFAAALLMPAEVVAREHARTPNPALLAPRFGVTAEAMKYRLNILGMR